MTGCCLQLHAHPEQHHVAVQVRLLVLLVLHVQGGAVMLHVQQSIAIQMDCGCCFQMHLLQLRINSIFEMDVIQLCTLAGFNCCASWHTNSQQGQGIKA